jgi:uncharacterized protein (TIGR00730 family)
MVKTICVFCASSSKVDEIYLNTARELADMCIEHQIHVLYGGGAFGLMGALADRILESEGKISGIIPDFMKAMQWAHNNVSEMIVVEDLRERKKRMIENVDAVVALPGGVGTLEELLEVITLKQLGRFNKPIIIVNTEGFYNALIQLFDEMIEKHFMRDIHRQLWTVIESPSDLLHAINNAPDLDASVFNQVAYAG